MATPQELLDTLLRITRLLSTRQSLEASLQAVVDAARALLAADHASIRLLDETRTRLLMGARTGEGTASRPVEFRPGEGVIGWVVAHGEALLIPDAAADPRFAPHAGQGFVIGSILAVPLVAADQTIGVLSLSAQATGAFGEEHALLARLLANSAVPTLEMSRLRQLAAQDTASGALRSSLLPSDLAAEITRAAEEFQALSLMYVELEGVDKVRETHSHEAADALLTLAARAIQGAARPGDHLYRRHGGTFLLVLSSTTTEEALAIAEAVKRQIGGKPIELEDGGRRMQTLSIGVATWNGEESARQLEERAELAMREARRAGKNQVKAALTARPSAAKDRPAPPPLPPGVAGPRPSAPGPEVSQLIEVEVEDEPIPAPAPPVEPPTTVGSAEGKAPAPTSVPVPAPDDEPEPLPDLPVDLVPPDPRP